MTIHQVPLNSFRKRDLVPQAILSRPISFIEDFGIRLVRDYDDLDEFSGAAIEANGYTFALLHYAGHEEGTATIYLPRELGDLEKITQVISYIVDVLNLPKSAIRWQRADNPEL